MTTDTRLVRISSKLADTMKQRAKDEGRTLEWLMNDAVTVYLGHRTTPGNDPEQHATSTPEPETVETGDWGA